MRKWVRRIVSDIFQISVYNSFSMRQNEKMLKQEWLRIVVSIYIPSCINVAALMKSFRNVKMDPLETFNQPRLLHIYSFLCYYPEMKYGWIEIWCGVHWPDKHNTLTDGSSSIFFSGRLPHWCFVLLIDWTLIEVAIIIHRNSAHSLINKHTN